MTKKDKIKRWFRNHQDILLVSGMVVAVVGGIAAIINAEVKAQDRESAKQNFLIDELNKTLESDRYDHDKEMLELQRMEDEEFRELIKVGRVKEYFPEATGEQIAAEVKRLTAVT